MFGAGEGPATHLRRARNFSIEKQSFHRKVSLQIAAGNSHPGLLTGSKDISSSIQVKTPRAVGALLGGVLQPSSN